MASGQVDYVTYLLRLQRTKYGEKVLWRATLESVPTRERKSFACLGDLFDFLRRRTGASSDSEESEQHGHDDRQD